jgi:TolB-like protein/DNA-binding winged helix-turn-helix (wHTH) protein
VQDAVHSSRFIRFEPFEVDLRTRELRKAGVNLKLAGQPFQILSILLEQPGEVVTREEFQKRLWPDTFVDFDHNLNTAINKIREVLGDSAESPRFVETLPRRGYRFVAPVNGTGQAPAAEAKPTGRPGPGLRMASLGALAVIAMAAVLLGLNVGGWRDRIFARHVNPPVQALAVLPLANLSGDPEQEYFADGMTEALITELGKVSSPRVISRQSVMQYKGSKKPLQEIARELNVDAFLEGAVERSGDRVRVSIHLDRVSPERQIWANQYNRDIRDALGLQDEIARAITDEVQVKLTPQEQARLASSRPADSEAQDNYLQGRYFSNRHTERDLQTAVGYFKKAIEKDPGYALAYLGLAQAYFYLPNPRVPGQHSPVETVPLARAAVSKALELDPSLGEAHVALAWSLVQDWDWPDAEKEARLALTQNPNSADAHLVYSLYLSGMGRNDEAFAHMNYAIQLDPLNSDYKNQLGWTAYWARQYDLAINQFKIGGDDFGLTAAYLAAKMYREAIEVAKESIRQSGRDASRVGLLALAYGSAGRKHDAQKLIDELNEMSHHSYVAPAIFVGAYIGLGDHDKSLTWLERGYEEHDQWLYKIKVSPFFDSLRSEPRFQAVLRRMNFPQ